MNYYCENCDKTIEPKSKNNHLKSLTHVQFEKCFQITRAIKNSGSLDIDKTINDYVTNHNRNFD